MSSYKLPTPPHNQALSSPTFHPPPLDGSLTMPEIYDWHLVNTPNHRLFLFAKDDGSLRSIYWPEAVHAVHVGAKIVRKRMSWTPGMRESPIIAILAQSDSIPYFTMIMGIMRANYVVFPISPRNSADAVAHLLNEVGVKHILVGREPSMHDLANSALDILKHQYPSALVPDLSPLPIFEELYLPSTSSSKPSLPDDLPYDNSKGPNALAMIVHSSGSTAFPKPIAFSVGRLVAYGLIPYFGERDLTDVVFSCHVVPMYHAMGLQLITITATCGLVAAMFEPKSPTPVATPDILFKALSATDCDILFCVPSFIEAWARKPEYVKWLAAHQGVIYGGGPLNKEAGDYLTSQGVSVFNLYGCSECGILNLILPAKVGYEWEYFKFPEKLVTPKLVPFGDNIFELVVVTNEYDQISVLNTKVDGYDAYATSDLLVSHPTKPGLWRVFGRTDDQIMHNTGEKTNPGPLESILNQDPRVQSCVMFGRGRFQAGILVEPKPDFRFNPSNEVKLAEFRNKIWPTVEKMNVFAPQHSRLFKEMILVTKPSKPFMYTAKNTARRQAIVNAYEDEINQAYDLVEASAQSGIPFPSQWDAVGIHDFVRTLVVKVLGQSVDDDDEIFQHGCDSLQATCICNAILRALRDSVQLDVPQNVGNFIYEYPSISRLSIFVSGLIFGSRTKAKSSLESKVEQMRAMAAKYTDDLPTRRTRNGAAPRIGAGDVVLLTGTTGSLGCYILNHLIQDPQVTRVYALNRDNKSGVTLLRRQKAALIERGADPAIVDSDKVVLFEGYLTRTHFGMPEDVFEEMHQSVTHIIHNAWPVDFNLSLLSFESNVKGLRHLIDFALSSPLSEPPQLMFTSSIGVFQNAPPDACFDETAIQPDSAVGTGYAESKWVSEQILSEAAAKTALKPLIIRVGQITGSVNGAWNAHEWFPSLVQTAAAMGYFPDDHRIVDWIPLDHASRAIVEFRKSPGMNPFVHLTHPRPVSWSSLATVICSDLSVKLIPYSEWFTMLEEAARSSSEGELELEKMDVSLLRKYHALRLLPFFRVAASKTGGTVALGLPKISVTHAMALSPTLGDKQVRELGAEDVRQWLMYWRQVGLLSQV